MHPTNALLYLAVARRGHYPHRTAFRVAGVFPCVRLVGLKIHAVAFAKRIEVFVQLDLQRTFNHINKHDLVHYLNLPLKGLAYHIKSQLRGLGFSTLHLKFVPNHGKIM